MSVGAMQAIIVILGGFIIIDVAIELFRWRAQRIAERERRDRIARWNRRKPGL